jgi:hypothetical protein
VPRALCQSARPHASSRPFHAGTCISKPSTLNPQPSTLKQLDPSLPCGPLTLVYIYIYPNPNPTARPPPLHTHTHTRMHTHEEDGLVFATAAQLSSRRLEMAECVRLLLDCVVLLGGRWRGVCGSGRVGLEMDRDRCKFSKKRAP